MKTKAIKVLASPAVSWILYILPQGNGESLHTFLLLETTSDGFPFQCSQPKFPCPCLISVASGLVTLLSLGEDACGKGREEEKGGLSMTTDP